MPRKQLRLIDYTDDPAIVKAADALADAEEEFQAAKKERDAWMADMLKLLKDSDKKRIKHRGITIEYKLTEAKEKLIIKGTPQKAQAKS